MSIRIKANDEYKKMRKRNCTILLQNAKKKKKQQNYIRNLKINHKNIIKAQNIRFDDQDESIKTNKIKFSLNKKRNVK